MTQVSTTLEMLLRVRQQGAEQLAAVNNEIERLRNAQGGLSDAARGASGAQAEQTREAQKASAGMTSLTALVRGLLGAYLGLAGVRRAVLLSDQQERAETRLLNTLRGQVESRERAVREQERLIALSGRLQREVGVFGDEAFVDAAAQIIQAAPESAREIERVMRATADLAVVAFDGDLRRAAEAIGRSLTGTGGQLVSQFRELREEQERIGEARFRQRLRGGLAVDFVERRFAGAAAEFAQTDVGRRQAALNQFNDALEAAGNALKTIFTPALEGTARVLEIVAAALQDVRGLIRDGELGDATLRRLGEALPGAAVAATLRGIGQPPTPHRALTDAERDELIERQRAFRETVAELERQRLELFDAISRNPIPGGAFRESQRATELQREASLIQSLIDQIQTQLDFEPGIGDDGPISPIASRLLLTEDQRRQLIGDLGLLEEFAEAALNIQRQFEQFEGFTPPGALGSPVLPGEGEQPRDVDTLFNLALTRERALALTRELAEAQEEHARALLRANQLAEAGVITHARQRELANDALLAFEEARKSVGAGADDVAAFATAQQAALQGLVDTPLPERPRFVDDLLEEIGLVDELLELLKRRLARGISAEVGERAFTPLSVFIDQLAEGEERLENLPDVFRRVLQRMLAEALAADLLSALLGGDRQSGFGGGGLLGRGVDILGGLLGFAGGGVVPGPDLGRDSTVIAARGGEYVHTPDVVRAPGVLGFFRALQATRGDIESALALAPRLGPTLRPTRRGGLPGAMPGYAGGGFVDAVASVSRTPGAGAVSEMVVLPVLVADTAQAERLTAHSSRLARAEAMASAARASSGGRQGFVGGGGLDR